MSNLKIGILEFGFRQEEQSSVNSLLDVMKYAEKADEMGFSRFWLGEHHNYYAMSSWSTPQMLLPLLLLQTERIHIGMAGVLMNYYSPYEIACNFKLLANLFPERCDLGFAAGTPPARIGQALLQSSYDNPPDNFRSNVERVCGYFHKEDELLTKDRIIIPPLKGQAPHLFMLSSSFKRYGEAVAGKMHIAKSIFHSPHSLKLEEKDTIQQYREQFYAQHGEEAQVVLAMVGTCYYREEEALRRSNTFREKAPGFRFLHNGVFGTPEIFQERLYNLSEKLGIDEFVIMDCSLYNEEKIESLHLLSEAFAMQSHLVNV